MLNHLESLSTLSEEGRITSYNVCYTKLLRAKIEQEVKPDLVHIWGTESIWADVYRKGYIKAKAVLEIQGLISAYVKYYYGGLNFSELLKCHSIV